MALKQILGKGAQAKELAWRMQLARIWMRWEELAGDAIAKHARPAQLMRGMLTIRVSHPTWKQELGLLKPQLLSRLREAFPEARLKDMRFEYGDLPEPPPIVSRNLRAPQRPLTEEEIEFIDRASEQISDEDIREAARRAMQRGFGTRRKGSNTD